MPFNHQEITSQFAHIFPVHVEALCELLIALRQQFLGDLDLMLIVAIISSRALPNSEPDKLSYSNFINDKNKPRAEQPINIQSVAECSGIPRETVRRKVNKLETLGFIERDSKGMLKLTDKAFDQLQPATEASLRYLVTLSDSTTAAQQAARP